MEWVLVKPLLAIERILGLGSLLKSKHGQLVVGCSTGDDWVLNGVIIVSIIVC